MNTEVFQANGTAERDAALVMLEQIPGVGRVTVGADKGYDTKDFVAECREMKVTPHVAQERKAEGRQCNQWPHNAPSRLRGESAETEAHRRVLRMVEDDRTHAKGTTPQHREGELGVYIRRGGVQPGANAESTGKDS